MSEAFRPGLIVLLLGLCLSALAVPRSVSDQSLGLGDAPRYTLSDGNLALWQDPSRVATAEEALDALREGRFAALKRAPRLGYSDHAAWLYFSLEVPTGAAQPRILEVGPAYLDRVTVLHIQPDGTRVQREAGDVMPWSARELPHRNFPFRLTLSPGKHEVLLRIESKGLLAATVDLWRPEAFSYQSERISLLLGLYFGMVLAIIAVNLSGWVVLRIPGSGMFVLVSVLGTAMWAGISGLADQVLSPALPGLADELLGFCVAAHNAATWFFFSILFEYRRYHPLLYRAAQGGIALGSLGALAALFGAYQVMAPVFQAFSVVGLLGAPAVIHRLWRLRQRAAKVVALSYLVFLVSLLSVVASTMGVFDFSEYALYGGFVSHGAFIFLFHFAMRYRTLSQRAALDEAEEERARLRRQVVLDRKAALALEKLRMLLAEEMQAPVVAICRPREPLTRLLDREGEDGARRGKARRLQTIEEAAGRLGHVFDLAKDRGDETQETDHELSHDALIHHSLAMLSSVDRDRILLSGAWGSEAFRGDRRRVRFAILNLFENALKYSPEGSAVRLTLARGRGTHERFWCLHIENEGPALSPEQLKHVFEKYWRGPRASDEGGLGLGLYLVKRIIEAEGGSVEFVEGRASGVEVAVCLPVGSGS